MPVNPANPSANAGINIHQSHTSHKFPFYHKNPVDNSFVFCIIATLTVVAGPQHVSRQSRSGGAQMSPVSWAFLGEKGYW